MRMHLKEINAIIRNWFDIGVGLVESPLNAAFNPLTTNSMAYETRFNAAFTKALQ